MSEAGSRSIEPECPVLTTFDLTRTEYLFDPFAVVGDLAKLPALFFAPLIDHYVLTRHADIEEVCLNPTAYSSASAQIPVVPLTPEAEQILREGEVYSAPSMISLDPPAHTRLRTPVAQALSAQRVAHMEPRIRARTRALLNAIQGTPPFDIMGTLASPLPSAVVFELVGLPGADWTQVLAWCAHRSTLVWGRPPPSEQAVHATNVAAYRSYLRNFVEAKRPNSDGDLTEALLAFDAHLPSRLSNDEVASILYSLTFAGHETTKYLIGNVVRQLLSEPNSWQGVVNDRSTIARTIEEVVRLDSSVPTLQRVVTEPVVLCGIRLPAGAKILLWLAAAGRDATAFPNEIVSDPLRSNISKSLGFGRGIHYCVGAHLGRLEAQVAIDELAATYPLLRLVAGQSFDFDANLSFRGTRELWVTAEQDS